MQITEIKNPMLRPLYVKINLGDDSRTSESKVNMKEETAFINAEIKSGDELARRLISATACLKAL